MDSLYKIQLSAERFPDRIAYRSADTSVSYKRLWDDACEYAALLKKQGNSPVIIYGHKSTDMVTAMLSCLMAGRPYVPVEEGTPLKRIERIIAYSGAALIISDTPLGINNVGCMKLSDIKCFSGEDGRDCSDERAYIIFTSGSTGEPKGVPILRSNLDNFTNWISGLFPLNQYEGATVFNQASFSFDLSVADLYYSLCNGHTLLSFPGNIVEDFNGFYETFRDADIAVFTPSFARLCLSDKCFNDKNFPKFKCVYFCGERLEVKTVRKLFEAFPKLEIINAYGPTEATSAVAAVRITKEMAAKEILLPVGEIATAATDIEISEDEIVLKGKSVFPGYLGDYKGGFYRKDSVNCYKTGDLGSIEQGLLYFKGRADSQIKYMGYRIELEEIEHHINRISGVKGCAVVARYSENGTVTAFKAYAEAEESVSPDDIKRELKSLVPHYMIPKTITVMRALPLNKNGKVDRKALINL